MSNNKQEIIKRINDINTELGLTNSPPVGGGSVSLRQLLDEILNKLTSVNNSDINGKILDIFNKNNNYYNELTSSSTSYMKGKVNDLYTKFNNIYNELYSTSTSYMKGKINSIYRTNNSMYSRINTLYTEITDDNDAWTMAGRILAMKNILTDGPHIDVRRGYVLVNESDLDSDGYLTIHHNWLETAYSFLILQPMVDYTHNRISLALRDRGNTYFKLHCHAGYGRVNTAFYWHIVEFTIP